MGPLVDKWTLLTCALAVGACLVRTTASRWGDLRRAAALLFLASPFAYRATRIVVRNLGQPPEWDYLGFWMHARTALGRRDFYDPAQGRISLGDVAVSPDFSREIVEVGFWYPPPSMFLFAPLGAFERSLGIYLWYAIQLCALAGCVYLLRRLFSSERGWLGWAWAGALTLGCHGTASNLHFAQTTFVALYAFLLFWQRRTEAQGGAWLAVAVLVKPLIGLVLLAPLFAKQGRVLVGFAASGLAAVLASILAFGVGPFTHYFLPSSPKPAWIYVEPTNQSLLGSTLRLGGAACADAGCMLYPPYLLGAAVVLAVSLAVTIRRRDADGAITLSLWSCAALLVYPVSQVFYSVLCLPTWLSLASTTRIGPWRWCLVLSSYAACAVADGQVAVVGFFLCWLGALWLCLADRSPSLPLAPSRGQPRKPVVGRNGRR